MIGGVNMVATKNDVISFVNNSSATELHAFCDFINDYQERKKAEAEFFKQMNIAEVNPGYVAADLLQNRVFYRSISTFKDVSKFPYHLKCFFCFGRWIPFKIFTDVGVTFHAGCHVRVLLCA